MDDQQFYQLLDRFGLSRAGYKKVRKGVKKRISRHMQQLRCRNITDYLNALEKDDEAKKECERLLTVSISRFFRDRRLWQALEKDIIPDLVKKEKEKINVYSAGCACGEEVYSFKIVWDRLKKSYACLPKLHITAIDMNPVYIERAKAGIYSYSSLKEVPIIFRSIYFKKKVGGKRFSVISSLKENITWNVQHFFSNPRDCRFHIILLRNNLLTYYQDELKKKVFKHILNGLTPSGFLIIGSHENLPFDTPDLTPFSSCSYIYKNRKKNK
ncbi:MAG: CheR family methyltransferase [Desulfobacterales bacterium]